MPFNRYCVDCKKNKSTHALLWVGIYVCQSCADVHKVTFGGNKEVLAKHVLKEQWDDYQLSSLAHGGNKSFFELLKEFEIDKAEPMDRHKHAAVVWYKARHVSRMDDMPFTTPKPKTGEQPKSQWNERLGVAKQTMAKSGTQFVSGMQYAGTSIASGSSKAATVISAKTSVWRE